MSACPVPTYFICKCSSWACAEELPSARVVAVEDIGEGYSEEWGRSKRRIDARGEGEASESGEAAPRGWRWSTTESPGEEIDLKRHVQSRGEQRVLQGG